EPVIDLAGRDPRGPLGQPYRRMSVTAIPRPHLGQVLLQRLRRPRHHRRHHPPPGRAAPHRLAEPHLAGPEPAQLRGGRIHREIADIQHGAPRVWWRLDSPQMLWSGWPLSSTVPPPGGTTV